MRFTISREKLQEGLGAVASSVPGKTTLPVLANLLLETTERGIRLSGTDLDIAVSGESFLTAPGQQVDRLRAAIAAATGVEPRLDTGGGTSDARFIARFCPVAEFGLVGATMHKADESVPVGELRRLADVYRAVLAAFV